MGIQHRAALQVRKLSPGAGELITCTRQASGNRDSTSGLEAKSQVIWRH
jgi:hypothetical protein